MQARDEHEDHADKFYRDEGWLATTPLTKHTVLDYFKASVFCDHRFLGDGVEYQVVPSGSEPMLFVIRKLAHIPGQAEPDKLAEYYVLQGSIYQAPDLFSLCSSRLRKCARFLQDAVEEVMAHSDFTPPEGRTWDFVPKPPQEVLAVATGSDDVGAGGGAKSAADRDVDGFKNLRTDEAAADRTLRLLMAALQAEKDKGGGAAKSKRRRTTSNAGSAPGAAHPATGGAVASTAGVAAGARQAGAGAGAGGSS